MKRAALKYGVLLMAFAAFSSIQIGAQNSVQTSAPEGAPTTLHTTTTLVVVPALVQTPANELVFSLTADDFILTDNGVPQKVRLETDTARSLSLVVLMQTGGAAQSQFKNYANLATMLAAELGGYPNKVSIVNFDSSVVAASPFTSDIAQWRDAIDHPDPGDSGAAIYDALDFALDLLKKQPTNTRRAILLISQQHDDGSKAHLKDIIRTVGETDTAVYSITFSAEKADFKQAFTGPPHLNKPLTVGNPPPTMVGSGTFTSEGPERPEQYQAYFNLGAPLGLALGAMRKNLSAEVANLSGGESSSFDNKVQLDEALGTLINRLRNSYILSFSPTSREPGLHMLQVRLAHYPDLLVTARTNYWSADPRETELPQDKLAPKPHLWHTHKSASTPN
jgi:VWFA-related protein